MTELNEAKKVAKELTAEEGGETGTATVAAIIYLAGKVMGLTEQVKRIADSKE